MLVFVNSRDGQSLLISRYQEWFSRAVQEWLSLSKAKLDARIHMAIKQDQVCALGLSSSR